MCVCVCVCVRERETGRERLKTTVLYNNLTTSTGMYKEILRKGEIERDCIPVI